MHGRQGGRRRVSLLGLDSVLADDDKIATAVLGNVRQKVALLDRLEEALCAVEHEAVGGGRVLSPYVHLVSGGLDAGVGAERALVLALARVSHLVPAQRVVVARAVVADVAAVRLLARVQADVQAQARFGGRWKGKLCKIVLEKFGKKRSHFFWPSRNHGKKSNKFEELLRFLCLCVARQMRLQMGLLLLLKGRKTRK